MAVTVGAPHLALFNLSLNTLDRHCHVHQAGDAVLLIVLVIKLQDDRVCFSTIDTRMLQQVCQHKGTVALPSIPVASYDCIRVGVVVFPLRLRMAKLAPCLAFVELTMLLAMRASLQEGTC